MRRTALFGVAAVLLASQAFAEPSWYKHLKPSPFGDLTQWTSSSNGSQAKGASAPQGKTGRTQRFASRGSSRRGGSSSLTSQKPRLNGSSRSLLSGTAGSAGVAAAASSGVSSLGGGLRSGRLDGFAGSSGIPQPHSGVGRHP